MVKSIYDNVVENIDNVREWLDCLRKESFDQQPAKQKKEKTKDSTVPIQNDENRIKSEEGSTFFEHAEEKSEQDIIDAIIDVMFYYEDEREAIRKDPLVRLLISNPPGDYNFTIVTAMGVITEGAKGLELEAALKRLETK
jgi:hypothetical protein